MSSELMKHEEELLREIWVRTQGVIAKPLKDQAVVSDERRHAQLIAGVANRDLMRWAETPTGKGKGAVILAAFADALPRLMGGRGYVELVPDSAVDEERLQVSPKGEKFCEQLFGRPWTGKPAAPRAITVVEPQAKSNNDALTGAKLSRKAAAAQRAPRSGGKFAAKSARPGVAQAEVEPEQTTEVDETEAPAMPRSYQAPA